MSDLLYIEGNSVMELLVYGYREILVILYSMRFDEIHFKIGRWQYRMEMRQRGFKYLTVAGYYMIVECIMKDAE